MPASRYCQAFVDDWKRLSVDAPRQGVIAPGTKLCSRRATEQVKHLQLCTTHARLAREGFVALTGQVAPREDIRNVRRYPEKYPKGLYSWAQETRRLRSGNVD